MKILITLLILVFSVPISAFCDGPSPKGNLHCRSLGLNAWLGVLFAAKAFHAAGLCRDDRDGAVYAIIESQAALGLGVGAEVGIAMVRSRLEIKKPSLFPRIIWHGSDDYPMKAFGTIIGGSVGGCFDTFYSNCENGNGDRSLGIGLGIFGGLDRRGGPALNNYVLLRLTPGMKWIKRPQNETSRSSPRPFHLEGEEEAADAR